MRQKGAVARSGMPECAVEYNVAGPVGPRPLEDASTEHDCLPCQVFCDYFRDNDCALVRLRSECAGMWSSFECENKEVEIALVRSFFRARSIELTSRMCFCDLSCLGLEIELC